MRSTRTTGAGVVAGALMMTSAMAVGLAGCSGGGRSAAKPGGPTAGIGRPAATGAAFGTAPSTTPSGSASSSYLTDAGTTLVAPEFRHPAAWSSPVLLPTAPLAGFGGQPPFSGLPGTVRGAPSGDLTLMTGQVRYGMVAVAGNVVAVPEFIGGSSGSSGATATATGGTSPTATGTSPDPGSAASVTIHLLDAETGRPIASHPLPDAHQYYGMEPVTVGGKTDVEVRYAQATTTSNDTQFASVVLDPTGAQVWSSAGQPVAGPQGAGMPGTTGLLGDRGTGLVHDGGYVERIDDPSPSDRTLANATLSVVDLTGKTVLTIPKVNNRDATDPSRRTGNTLQLAGGYAVVTSVDAPPPLANGAQEDPATLLPIRFTVYDLAHNAKKTANFAVPAVSELGGAGYGFGAVLATCGSKLLLEWPTITLHSTPEGTIADLAVLDAATGKASSPPIAIPTSMPGGLQSTLRATTDPSCSAAMVNGMVGVTRPAMLAVDWAHGQPLWKQLGAYPPTPGSPQVTFQALAARGGVVYGIRTVGSVTQAATIGLSDGKVRETGFGLSPVAFTAAGAPVFVQIDLPGPQPYSYVVTTTPTGATTGQTVRMTTTPPPPPPSTPTIVPSPSSPSPWQSSTPPNQYAMTVWAGSS